MVRKHNQSYVNRKLTQKKYREKLKDRLLLSKLPVGFVIPSEPVMLDYLQTKNINLKGLTTVNIIVSKSYLILIILYLNILYYAASLCPSDA